MKTDQVDHCFEDQMRNLEVLVCKQKITTLNAENVKKWWFDADFVVFDFEILILGHWRHQ